MNTKTILTVALVGVAGVSVYFLAKQFIPKTITSIQITNPKSVIHIAEIEIIDSRGKVLPLDGVPSQSSTYGTSTANLAIDGNTNQDWHGNSMSHTEHGVNDWWKMEFTTPMKIPKGSQIKIYNRTDCCSERLKGAKLELFSNSKVIFEQTLTEKDVQTYAI